LWALDGSAVEDDCADFSQPASSPDSSSASTLVLLIVWLREQGTQECSELALAASGGGLKRPGSA